MNPDDPSDSPLPPTDVDIDIDDETLRDYLAERLPPSAMARVEKALRDSASLRGRLEDVRHDRDDLQLHTLGAIWRRARLTCPTREQLGGYLLDAIDPELASYITFHLEVVACPFCQANLADLKARAEPPSAGRSPENRRHRILASSRHLLSGGEERD